MLEFLSPSEPLKLYEGVVYGVLFLDDQASACAYYREGCFQTPISVLVGRAGIEPAVPRLKVVCLTTRLPAHIFGGSSLIRTGNCEFCRLPSYRLTKEPDGTRGRIQTYDLPLRRRLLLFAELLGYMVGPLGLEPR